MYLKFILPRRKLLRLIVLVVVILFSWTLIDVSGRLRYLQEIDYSQFAYPLEVERFRPLVQKFRDGDPTQYQPINLNYSTLRIESYSGSACPEDLDLLILVKSGLANFENRKSIRHTWGNSQQSIDIKIKTMFLLGHPEDPSEVYLTENGNSVALETWIEDEGRRFGDIVRGNFTDSYYNLTYKTVMGMRWAVENCPNFKFALSADDDMYLSIKNLWRFAQNPGAYPIAANMSPQNPLETISGDHRIYAGHLKHGRAHRHKHGTKWFISVADYPFNAYPPYISGAAVLLSQAALSDLYYASFFTQHFPFDDVFVGFCAKKMEIEPQHSDYFDVYYSYNSLSTKPYGREYSNLIALNGFGDAHELLSFWNLQKSLRNV